MFKHFEDTGLIFAVINSYINKKTNKCVFKVTDNLRYPFTDFSAEAFNFKLDLPDFDPCPKIFIIAGDSKRVHLLKEIWEEKIKSFFNNICEQDHSLENFINETQRYQYVSSEVFLNLFIHHLVKDKKIKCPQRLMFEKDDAVILVLYGSKSYHSKEESLIESIINLWIDREQPHLKGYQCFTRSFILKSFIGRKILSALPDNEMGYWTLLLEGGWILPIDNSFEKFIRKVDSSYLGQWSIGEVEDIINNPVYSYGYLFEQQELFVEWQYVLLYALATLPITEFEYPIIEKLYVDFCEFIAMYISPCVEVKDRIIEKEKQLTVFMKSIFQIRSYLAGEEETGISKNVIFLLRSRYAYLPSIYRLLSKYYQKKVKERLNTVHFKEKKFRKLLNGVMSSSDTYNKGIKLEELADYFFRTIPGLIITGRRARKEREEVDLYCSNVSYESILWELGPLILVECKNKKRKVKVSEIRNLIPIMDSKGIKSAVVFSSSGFTKTALKEIEYQYFGGKYIIPFDMADIKCLTKSFTPFDLLVSKVEKMGKKYANDLRNAYF
ncbi:restriction endonuclease [Biomaibacter acetigenes]|nr:restriction endonuclease [Biomaibacter acetigenes]